MGGPQLTFGIFWRPCLYTKLTKAKAWVSELTCDCLYFLKVKLFSSMVLYHILLCFEERNLDMVWTRMLRRSRKSNLFGAGKKILAIQSYIIPYHLTLNLVNKSLACFLCWSRNSLRYLESQRPLEGNYSKIKWLVGLGKSISGGTKQHLGNNLMLKAAADPQLVKLTKTNTYFLWEMRI